MTDTLTCGDCDFARGTKNTVMLQCHCDRRTGEFVKKTQGYVSKDGKACEFFLPIGIARPDPNSPLVVLIRAKKRGVFRAYPTKKDVPYKYKYCDMLSSVMGTTELLYQHKGQSLIQLESEDKRVSIFNITYFNITYFYIGGSARAAIQKARRAGLTDFDPTSPESHEAMRQVEVIPGPPELLLP